MNQCSNPTMDDKFFNLSKNPQVTTPNCDEDNANMNLSISLKIEEFERRTKNLRNSNSELENRVKDLQNQVKNLESH